MRVLWTHRAARQLEDSLSDLRADSAERLAESVREVVELLGEGGRMFPRIPGVDDGEVRRALIRRYRTWVIFEVFDEREEIIVLAVWNARREPDGWRQP